MSLGSGWVIDRMALKMKSAEKLCELLAFKLKMREVLLNNQNEIMDKFYDEWCLIMEEIDTKRRDARWLSNSCTMVKCRFVTVLNRFIAALDGNDDWSFGDEQALIDYSLRFVIPAIRNDLDTHVVVRIVKSFFNTVLDVVLNSINPSDYSLTEADVENILSELVYMSFENLWVTSVIGFKYQQATIRELLSKLMRAQEEERQKFWSEIHDDILQTLAIIPLRLQVIEDISEANPQAVKVELNKLRQIVEESTRAIREISHGFNLFWIERKGLEFSVRIFVTRFEREFAIPVDLTMSGKMGNMSGFPGVTLFRIIQEALFNAGKHSKATLIKVKVSKRSRELEIEIEDNGIGFDVRQTMRNRFELRNLGLLFMKERVKLLNGSMKVKSSKGAGTNIRVHVPITIFSQDHNSLNNGESGARINHETD